jgi:hypothetical protein
MNIDTFVSLFTRDDGDDVNGLDTPLINPRLVRQLAGHQERDTLPGIFRKQGDRWRPRVSR